MTAFAKHAKAIMSFDFGNVRGDIFGGVTAGIVALPLALAFGVASGVGPIAGLYGAIAVGFFASLFGGTGAQISGPTGPMIVVFAGVFASLSGQPELIFAAVVLAGLIQIAMGVLGVGQYIRLVPYPVVSGFMSGIGAIIIILQLGRLMGHETPSGTIASLQYLPTAITDPNLSAFGLAMLTLAVVFFWPAKWGRIVPGPLVALIAGTLLGLLLPGVPILEDIPTGLPELIIPSFGDGSLVIIAKAAVILALLGAIDSLLTSLVADNMTGTRHESNRELVGQGIGNTIAGFIGGIPGAGATMRTVVNIRAGGATRLSGMIHSLLLLAIVLVLSPLAEKIPHAVLAGILVKVGYDIIDWSYLRRAHAGPRWDLLLMVLVLGLTVFVDLITAVGVGVVLAALAFVRQVADTQLKELLQRPEHAENPKERELLAQGEGRISVFAFAGPLSFGAAADLGHHVRQKVERDSEAIILDFERVPFLDLSAARAVQTIAADATANGKRIYVCAMNDSVRATLSGLKADAQIPDDAYMPSRIVALRRALTDSGITPLNGGDGGGSLRSTGGPAPLPAE